MTMMEALYDIPLEPDAVAGIRALCDARGFSAGCRRMACRRTRRCRAGWRSDPYGSRIVLPPCLLDVYDKVIDDAVEAEQRLLDFQRDVAMARGWPDPDDPGSD